MIDSPIFIVGPPRSGTTLLRYCLNAHPEIYILPETHFFFHIFGKRYYNRYSSIPHNSERIIRQIFQRSGDPSLEKYRAIQEKLADRCRNDVRNMKELFSTIMQSISDQYEVSITGEKTPNHFFFIPLIRKWYPSARIFFMKRDPKLIAASYIHNKPQETYDTRKKALRRIAALTKSANRILEQHKEECFPISYHNLTHHPREVLSRMCAHLQINFSNRMLKPGVNNSSYGPNPGHHTDPTLKIIPQDPDKWKKVLTPEEATYIMQFCEGSLKGKKHIQTYPALLRIKTEKYLSRVGLNPF